MWGILLVLLIGGAYGYFTPGRTDKSTLFKRAFLWGVGISLVLAVLGYLLGADPLLLTTVGLVGGLVALVVNVLVLTLVFVGGAWLGDVLEHRRDARRGAGRV